MYHLHCAVWVVSGRLPCF